MARGPNSSKAKVRSRSCSSRYSMRASFSSRSGIGRLLPGLGALEGDLRPRRGSGAAAPRDPDLSSLLGRQVVRQLAHAPAGEGLAEAAWALGGRLDDQLALLSRYPAGTATRPLRVQAPIPLSLKAWIISRTRSGLVWTSRAIAATSLPPRRGEHDQGPTPLDDGPVGLAAAPAHDPLELPTLLVGEPAHLHWSSHGASFARPASSGGGRALEVAGQGTSCR